MDSIIERGVGHHSQEGEEPCVRGPAAHHHSLARYFTGVSDKVLVGIGLWFFAFIALPWIGQRHDGNNDGESISAQA